MRLDKIEDVTDYLVNTILPRMEHPWLGSYVRSTRDNLGQKQKQRFLLQFAMDLANCSKLRLVRTLDESLPVSNGFMGSVV